MFCGKCGAKNPDGAAFCGSCGAHLTQAAPEQRSAAPAQNAATHPPSDGNNSHRPRRRIGLAPVAIVIAALIFIVRGFGGKDMPPADDSPTSPVQDTSTSDENGSQEDGMEDNRGGVTEGGEGSDAGSGEESSSTSSGLTGKADSSGVITIALTDMGEYNAVVLSDNDWNVLADLRKSVTYVSDGLTYYLGSDRLAPLDLDADRNLIMQIPKHWLHIGGMRPYINYVGSYSEPQGEYVAYALVNSSDAFLSVITDWNSYINIQGYYVGDLSSGEYEDTLYEFYQNDEVVLIMVTNDGIWGTEPYAPGELSVEYKAINTENLSELSVRYMMTDINGQRYCTPYSTWK